MPHPRDAQGQAIQGTEESGLAESGHNHGRVGGRGAQPDDL